MNEEENDRLEVILQAAEHNHQTLNDREKQFISDTRERFEQYGADTKVSPKQWDWLERIYSKC